MRIKAKYSFITRGGVSATAGDVLSVSDDQGNKLIKANMAEAANEPDHGVKAEPAKG